MFVEVEFDPEAATELKRGYTLGRFLAVIIGEWGLSGSKEWEEDLKRAVQDHSNDCPRNTMHGMSYLIGVLADSTGDPQLIELAKDFGKKVGERMDELDQEEINSRRQ